MVQAVYSSERTNDMTRHGRRIKCGLEGERLLANEPQDGSTDRLEAYEQTYENKTKEQTILETEFHVSTAIGVGTASTSAFALLVSAALPSPAAASASSCVYAGALSARHRLLWTFDFQWDCKAASDSWCFAHSTQ